MTGMLWKSTPVEDLTDFELENASVWLAQNDHFLTSRIHKARDLHAQMHAAVSKELSLRADKRI